MPRARHDPHPVDIHSPLPLNLHPAPAPASAAHRATIINPLPRSSSLQSMGQVLSSPSPPPSPAKSLGSAGQRLRRVFAARKKKTEDHVEHAPQPSPDYNSPGGGRLRTVTAPTPPSSHQTSTSSSYAPVETTAPPRRRPPPLGDQPSPSPSPGFGTFVDSPPPLPPKSPRMDPGMNRTPRSAFVASPEPLPSPSPSVTSAKSLSNEGQGPPSEPPSNPPSPDPPSPAPRIQHEKKDPEQEKLKEDWRKSDATMSSYHTVRPRSVASGGVRTRPVSMAESLHSNSTVMATNKRLSALLTEAEFIMTEEDVSSDSRRISLTRQSSPSGSVKTRKRHSISLHFTSPFPSSTSPPSSPPASDASHGRPRRSNGEIPPSSATLSASPVPNVTRTAARGIIGGSQKEGSIQSTGSHIKGRLAALTATSVSAASTPTHMQSSHPIPQGWAPAPTPPTEPPRRSPGPANTTFRQPAVSISSTAGFALGFGKRAVERMGRAFGGIGGSSSSSSTSTNHSQHALGLGQGPQSGYSSSSSSIGAPEEWAAHKGKLRHTPNAPSGTWSISTSATGSSTSDSGQQGPHLGPRIRGPFASSGVVFGRPLEACVRDTALEHVRIALSQAEEENGAGSYDAGVDAALEQRLLPALVVRCVQHIMKWGIEEEGLFRISGRTSTISKLRSEFDTGADFDLAESPPGDLDPHAVTSIFKAYLRELPEPILTKSLNPLFEAAMNMENDARKSVEISPVPKFGARRSALPSNPRDGRSLMKPPSLSTLAMPNFAAMRPPSEALLDEFTSLIARLPPVNRDLLRTVTDLIKITATRRETRMPLSNLTVVFCPSLNMSPSILRVLCEAEDIWTGPRNNITSQIPPTLSIVTQDQVEANGDNGVDDAASTMSRKEGDGRSVASSSNPAESFDTANVDARVTMLSTTDDSGSYFSATDSRPPSPHEHGQDPAWVPPELSSSSSSSIATPSTFSEDPPTSGPSPDVSGLYDLYSKPITPIIAQLEAESLAGGKPYISAPMPTVFPTRDPSPSKPVSRRGSAHLDSIPQGFGNGTSEAASRSTSKLARSRRPSLAALFSKRSMSSMRSSRVLSISSPYLSGSSSGSSSPLISPSTPHSTIAQPPTAVLPPVLNTPIDNSRIDLPLEMQSPVDPNEDEDKNKRRDHYKDWRRWRSEGDGDSQRRRAGSSVDVRPRSSQPPRLTAASSPHLPASHLPSADSLTTPDDMLSPGRGLTSPPITASSSGSSSRLSLWEDDGDSPRDDDWASSVLLAADAGWLSASAEATA